MIKTILKIITLLIVLLMVMPLIQGGAAKLRNSSTTDTVINQGGTANPSIITRNNNISTGITITDFNTTNTTIHWAAFLGNSTGSMMFGTGEGQGNNVFEIEYNASNLKALAATTDPFFNWGNLTSVTNDGQFDLALNITPNALDSVKTMFVNTTQTYFGIGGFKTIFTNTNTGSATTVTSSFAASIGASTTTPGNNGFGLDEIVFFAKINEGAPIMSYNGSFTVEYQLLVGINETENPNDQDTELTYYFWAIS